MRYFEPHTPAETAFTEKAKILYEQLISVNPVERGTATEAFDFLFGNKQEEAAGVVTLSALNLA
jgi:hypothetical protein